MLLASCFGHRPKAAKVPKPANIPAATETRKSPAEQPQIAPPEVAIETLHTADAAGHREGTAGCPRHPSRRPGGDVRPPRPPRRPATESAKPAVATPETATPPAPVQLGPLLSSDAQRAYAQAVAELIAKAERNLAAAQARGPKRAATRSDGPVSRRFIAQAQEIKGRDLPAAKSLAERAEIVSREVLGQF